MPSQTTTVATKARTKPINRDTVKSKQELRHKEKKDKKKKTQLKSTTVPVVQKKEGSKLTDTSDPSKNKVSPKEAARLAAEKRFQETNEKYNKGELGKS